MKPAMIKAILIDPETKTVKQIELEYDGRSLENFHEVMGCDIVDLVRLTDHHMLLVDDEGLLKPNYHFMFPDSNVPFSGKACLVGNNEAGDIVNTYLKPGADIVMKLTIKWFGDDEGLEEAINKGRVSRPATTFASMGPNLEAIEETRKTIWEWAPNKKNAPLD